MDSAEMLIRYREAYLWGRTDCVNPQDILRANGYSRALSFSERERLLSEINRLERSMNLPLTQRINKNI